MQLLLLKMELTDGACDCASVGGIMWSSILKDLSLGADMVLGFVCFCGGSLFINIGFEALFRAVRCDFENSPEAQIYCYRFVVD